MLKLSKTTIEIYINLMFFRQKIIWKALWKKKLLQCQTCISVYLKKLYIIAFLKSKSKIIFLVEIMQTKLL
jgi:hypothetical protein